MTFAATWMDLETVILSEVKHMKSLTYGSLEKKNDTSEVVYRTEKDSQT